MEGVLEKRQEGQDCVYFLHGLEQTKVGSREKEKDR